MNWRYSITEYIWLKHPLRSLLKLMCQSNTIFVPYICIIVQKFHIFALPAYFEFVLICRHYFVLLHTFAYFFVYFGVFYNSLIQNKMHNLADFYMFLQTFKIFGILLSIFYFLSIVMWSIFHFLFIVIKGELTFHNSKVQCAARAPAQPSCIWWYSSNS